MNSTQYCLDVEKVQEIIDNPKKTIYGIFEPELPSIVSPEIKEGKVETQVFNVVENFDIIPSHLSIMLSNIGENPLKLKKYIRDKDLMNNYDIIIIDAPPLCQATQKQHFFALIII